MGWGVALGWPRGGLEMGLGWTRGGLGLARGGHGLARGGQELARGGQGWMGVVIGVDMD